MAWILLILALYVMGIVIVELVIVNDTYGLFSYDEITYARKNVLKSWYVFLKIGTNREM